MTNYSTSEDPGKFALWVKEKMPDLAYMFDFEKQERIDDNVEDYFTLASHREYLRGNFILSIWDQDNRFQFDFVDAARTLNQQDMSIITDWLNSPIWP
jgi:hypothetical protein